MRSEPSPTRSRSRGQRTATGPMPVMISRSGRCPWRTSRWRPSAVSLSAWQLSKAATSASTACASSAQAPLRKTSVSESAKLPGWESRKTLVSVTAYHSLYGAFFVKEFQQPIFLPSSVSLFDPKAPVPSSPTRHSGKPSRAGAVKAGRLFGDHPRGLALTVPSTAAPSNAVGLGPKDPDQRGARVRARIYRATTLYSVGPRTRTMMQSCASVATLRSGGPILCYGVISHGVHRVSATSNRHRRPVTSGRAGPKLLGAFCVLRSLCGTQNDAVRHHAVPHESPQCDQKLARQGHDHGLASAAGVLGAGSEPLRQGAVRLEHEKAPRQLDHGWNGS